MESSQHALTERGYELDQACQAAQNEVNEANLELERSTARQQANLERLTELATRLVAIAAELEQTRVEMAWRHRRTLRTETIPQNRSK